MKLPKIMFISIVAALFWAILPSGTVFAQSANNVFGEGTLSISTSSQTENTQEPSTVGSGLGGSFTGTVHAVPGLNVRTGPWGAIIGSLGDGATVTVLGQEGDWYKVSYNGTTAYCHSDYISGSSSNSSSSTSTGTVHAVPALNVRTGPWGTIIGSFGDGATVTVLGKEGDWYKVSYNGSTAYCHSDYITVGGSSVSSSFTGYVNASIGLNARSGPWGNIITCFPDGTSLNIVGQEGDWYKVSWNGQIVYCHSSYISRASTSSTAVSSSTSTAGSTSGILNVPQQCQGNVACPYPWSACGPTSLGMAIAYYTNQKPGSLASSLWYQCGSTGSAGTSHAGMLSGARQHGFPNAKWSYSVGASWVKEQIQAGKPVIANVAHHYVVITGIDAAGNVHYNDPAKSSVAQVKSWSDFSAWWNGGGCYHAAMTLK